jgi:hypothetical protein
MDGVYINSMMPCSLSIPGKVIGFSWLQLEQDGTIYLISFPLTGAMTQTSRADPILSKVQFPTTCNHTIHVLLL